MENDARTRAKKGLTKSWTDRPDHVIDAERDMLSEQHASQVAEGVHRGRVNFVTGLVEPYLVMDLPSKATIAADNVFISNDEISLSHVYESIRSSSNPKLAFKINAYVDRFLHVVSSTTPLTRQRDLDERSYSVLSFGLERPQPDAFYLPAAYLCHTVFFEDIRTYDDGSIWQSETWRPSTRNHSSIEIFSSPASLTIIKPICINIFCVLMKADF